MRLSVPGVLKKLQQCLWDHYFASHARPRRVVIMERMLSDLMSEASPSFDSIYKLIISCTAQHADHAQSHSRADADLLPLNIGADAALRKSFAGLGVTIDDEFVYLLDPSQLPLKISRKVEQDKHLSLMSAHQWHRYGKNKRSSPSSMNVIAAWQRRLRQIAVTLGDHTLLGLIEHSEPARGDGANTVYDMDKASTATKLSSIYPISADVFLTLAGSVGLFCPEPPLFEKDTNGIAHRTLYCLSNREYTVRFARETDIDSLDRLEALCWASELRSSRESLLSRITNYPQGQFVLEINGEIKGVIYSQRIRNEFDLSERDMDNVHELHDPAGEVVQLLAVNIDPDSQDLACGDQLLEFMLQRSCLQQAVKKIVAVTLCKNFVAEDGLTIAEYVFGPGIERDRVLHFHHIHGADIAAILPNYRPRDLANLGNGVLVKYDLTRRRQSRLSEQAQTPMPTNALARAQRDIDHQNARNFILDTIAELIGNGHSVDPERPLMESGLDSAGLLTLKPKLEVYFGQRLKPAIFFTHNTPQKIIDFLCADTAAASKLDSLSQQIPAGSANVDAATTASTMRRVPVLGDDSDVAIVGIACRLPNGIDDLNALWSTLESQRDVIADYPETRGDWPRGGSIERGGFLIDGECFDASFFRMSPSEAEVTDPQQRLLLETSWACFEDACIVPARLRGSDTGVFVGASNADYAHLLQEVGAEIEAHSAAGNSLAILANRLSYFYDFNGPSLLIDTACSSSLVAMHSAIQSLRAGECKMALVGGVNFICNPRISISYQKAGMLAPDGKCKVFDESADGYVRSEGAVMLLIKPLCDAIEDRNRIHAVVRGSAVNHGGQAAGLTVPNPQKQASLLLSAWRNARIEPNQISYLEAHGTGTSLGDPLEIDGMLLAFGGEKHAAVEARCGVGSVKSNLGHLESAAGLVGLIKTIASMAHGRLPASIHITTLSSKMGLDGAPLYIQAKPQDWNAPKPRIAGVSSFGSGGANGHVVVQEYIDDKREMDADLSATNTFPHGNLFVISAIDAMSLRRNVRNVVDWLLGKPSSHRFIDALYTWQCARTPFKCRIALLVTDFEDLKVKLQHWLDDGGHDFRLVNFEPSTRYEDRGTALWDNAIAHREWKALAQLWLQGNEGDWSALYAALPSTPRFLKLPTYSFSKDRHWAPIAHVSSSATTKDSASDADIDTQYLQPIWEHRELSAVVDDRDIADRKTHVFAFGMRQFDEYSLRIALPNTHLSLIDIDGDTIASRYKSLALQCFSRVASLLNNSSAEAIRLQVIAHDRGDGGWIYGLHGLLKSASIEEPRLNWQIISVPAAITIERFHALLIANQRSFENGASIKYTDSERFTRGWAPVLKKATRETATRVHPKNGTYLITGGLGGLGRLFAKHILDTRPDASVIVTGRSNADSRIDHDLASWNAGTRLDYRQITFAKRDDVDMLIARLREDGVVLRGILHCAGQVEDNFIANKSSEEFARVLEPKLNGTLFLDEATRDIDVEFFILFSSVMSETGNAGQADYACANGFLDQYAAYRNGLVAKGERRGHSVAINWPLWHDGGMRIDASALALLKETRGMLPMPPEVGLDFYRSQLWRDANQILILHGDTRKLSAGLAAEALPPTVQVDNLDVTALLASSENALRALVAEQLKLPIEKLDAQEELTHYGIDSIFINKINLALSRHFGSASKTLFFQYRTVSDIATHLVEQHPYECLTWTSGLEPARLLSNRAEAAASGRMHEAHGERTASPSDRHNRAIAIIGMSGVFPQANDLDAYWENLATGKDSVIDVPQDRWNIDEFYEPDPKRALELGKSYCKSGAFIGDFAKFDPMFFGISPREAINIDPHERLFLQEAWRAMEDAGYSSEELRRRHNRRVGVFVGITKTEFELNGAQDPRAGDKWYPRTSFSSVANRLSFFMDLAGPSMPVDTMCSSSLTAIHHACEQIRLDACEAAFVGGVNLYLHPSSYYYLSSLRMLSSDGRCRSFGEGGSGFVPGEGAAVVLLKSLDRAIDDGDDVHGVILASQVNHGGRTNGFMVPNPRAQADLIRETLLKSGVNARHVSYIEAHGTGTALGDPIEIDGLQQAFRVDTNDRQYCAIGSAKSNIGHLEAAAGIAGLIKVLLQMKHKQLVPTLHAERVNPNIHFSTTPFVLNRELREWKRPIVGGITFQRIAGVSSFGAGGVNAHVLLHEYEHEQYDSNEALQQPPLHKKAVLVPLSAFRREQLRARALQLLNLLDGSGHHLDLERLAYTLQFGRDAMAHRVAFVVDSMEGLRANLSMFLEERSDRTGDSSTIVSETSSKVRLSQDVEACFVGDECRDLQGLAAAWTVGASVDWKRLYRGKKDILRMHLPTYPFAKESYWHARLDGTNSAQDERMSAVSLSFQAPSSTVPDAVDVLYAVPLWEPLRDKPPTDTDFVRRSVLLCDIDIASTTLSAVLFNGRVEPSDCRVIALSASGSDAKQRYQSIALMCFERLRELAQDMRAGKVLVQCVIPGSDESNIYRGLYGMLRTLSMEQSRFCCQLICVDEAIDARTLASNLSRLADHRSTLCVRCDDQKMFTLDWKPLELDQADHSVYKDDGVYLITGGLGALGFIFAKSIVEKCSHATVILTGRSPLTEVIARKLNGLQHAQSRAVYVQLDINDATSVTAVIGSIEARHRKINGIIHAAGMIADCLIDKKSSQDFETTLAPKVNGAYYLDQATRHLNLDFFAVFSSIASAMGSIGQCDYAAANGFMDHFVLYRRELAGRGLRRGASVSINWPYWRAGGMRIDATTQSVLAQSIGMLPMETDIGLSAFHRIVAMDCAQIVVAQGDTCKLLARLRGANADEHPVGYALTARTLSTLDAIQKELRQMLANVLHAQADDIELRKPLVELGLDSVLGTEFVSIINQRFGSALSSVGIYDYPTVMALAQYLFSAQPKRSEISNMVHEQSARYVVHRTDSRRDLESEHKKHPSKVDEKLAVIGMSGRYPQAANLDQYWQNLAAAKNSIVEMPRSRWDVDAYYDTDPDSEGKMYTKWMGVLDNADSFDPRFFRITPQEALYMDPEQRLFLQESYRALEDAGYVGSDVDGARCGVYLGMESSEYSWHFATSPRVSETITGNHSAIAASRLAYFLNLKGPALAVDTACSSSLVATHLACQALRSGEIDLALVGGVRLWLSPVTHIGMSKARMLSPTGQCRTFDDAADGIVMGEGVGAVVLKRLNDAERDGDHIHGVIIASAINQDGRTNGITAPSVKSQIALERQLYRDNDIHPESISYIEAHGTGTKLGDPIELEALAAVFKEQTQREGYCAIGSVKSNIGHTAAASGIASLHKVLLCLKHKHLVPTLNVVNENRHFDFERSPFYINRDYKAWYPALGGTRRACISSFGFSGTNAHLVIEEYSQQPQASETLGVGPEMLIVLSARNPAQLRQKAQDILNFIERETLCDDDSHSERASWLVSMAYMLQVGRAPMEERAAFVVQSIDGLKNCLRVLAEGASENLGIQRGRAIDEDETSDLWNTDEDLRQTLDKWLYERKLSKLASLWTKGVHFDWLKLYGDRLPTRMSLPTYPFAEEKYWVERDTEEEPERLAVRHVNALHPLVHRNVSDLGRQAYRSNFKANDFFLSDHVVNGVRVLPGVAYLEMARAAVELALPTERLRYLEFQDHAWIQPIVVDSEAEITIALFDNGADTEGANGKVDYEITSETETSSSLHCRGSIRYSTNSSLASIVDIARLIGDISDTNYDVAALYERFATLGLRYGSSMQGIADISTNDHEAFARLHLPSGLEADLQNYMLHPSIMDAAMQCTMCLMDGFGSGSAKAAMPFSFDTMRVYAATERDMLAWIRPSSGASARRSKSFDIDIMTDDGKACVQIRGLVARTTSDASTGEKMSRLDVSDRPTLLIAAKTQPNEAMTTELRALLPKWNPIRFGSDTAVPYAGDKCLLLCGDDRVFDWLRIAIPDLRHAHVQPDASIDNIKDILTEQSFDHLMWFAPELNDSDTSSLIDSQNVGVLSLFRIIKALTKLDYLERDLKITIVTRMTQQVYDTDPVLPHHAGVNGMIGSVAKELPLWHMRLVDIEPASPLSAEEILILPWDAHGKGLAHRGNEWFRQEFADVRRIPASSPGYKHNGVYVVIGGAGGLGEVWTRHMVERFDANVIWIGRRSIDSDIEAKLDSIATIGKRPDYIAADACDEAALASAIQDITNRFHKIDGVVHSALVLQDQSVRGMDEAVFRQSLAAKVDVSVNLEKVFRDYDLDFMLFFSSLSSFYRGAGQSNYCAGCTFKDSFAQSIRMTRRYPVKIVNWGYWGSVGIVTDAFYRKRMETMGIGSIEPDEAMRALQLFVGSDMNQLVLVKVISETALDELLVSEEIRYYPDPGKDSQILADAAIAL